MVGPFEFDAAFKKQVGKSVEERALGFSGLYEKVPRGFAALHPLASLVCLNLDVWQSDEILAHPGAGRPPAGGAAPAAAGAAGPRPGLRAAPDPEARRVLAARLGCEAGAGSSKKDDGRPSVNVLILERCKSGYILQISRKERGIASIPDDHKT